MATIPLVTKSCPPVRFRTHCFLYTQWRSYLKTFTKISGVWRLTYPRPEVPKLIWPIICPPFWGGVTPCSPRKLPFLREQTRGSTLFVTEAITTTPPQIVPIMLPTLGNTDLDFHSVSKILHCP